MPKFRWTDILVELIDLCHERMQELRQQLVYYRASVYKAETAGLIGSKIEQLQLISSLIAEDLVEAFTDYEETAKAGFVQGECSLSQRLTMLLGTLDNHLVRISGELASRQTPENESEFAESVRKHRHLLLTLCRHGSRQWAFFQSL